MKHCLKLLFFTTSLTAQDAQVPWLNLNTPHRLIGDKVRVRNAPDSKAKILAELSLGSEVVPLEQARHTMTGEGVSAPWYKVRYVRDGKRAEGFIWGKLIARAHALSKSGELFLFGTGRRQEPATEGTEFTSQVRVVRDGEELARLEVKDGAPFEAKYESRLTDGRGLEKVKNIFAVKFIQEYCGGKGNTLFFFWDGSKLLHAHSSVEGFDAPHYALERQIFPADKGGRKGFVIVEREYGNHDDPAETKRETVILKWTGQQLAGP